MENKKKTFHFEYVNENEFRKKERSVRKYNMLAYKKLMFEYYPSIRDGKLLGKLVSKSRKDNSENYELKLPTDSLFSKVHGDLTLHYTVYLNNDIILLKTITPEEILSEGHRSELGTYKGVMISKTNSEKDMFKINLLNALDRK